MNGHKSGEKEREQVLNLAQNDAPSVHRAMIGAIVKDACDVYINS